VAWKLIGGIYLGVMIGWPSVRTLISRYTLRGVFGRLNLVMIFFKERTKEKTTTPSAVVEAQK